MAIDRLDEQASRNPDRLQTTNVRIVDLTPDQWTVLRDLKLRSLDQESVAFADVEEEREKYIARSEDEWRGILAGKMSGGRQGETVMVFAIDGDRYVGMVSAIIPAQQFSEKTATIQHMYVDNEGYRGLGIGRSLLSALLEKLKSRGDVGKAELSVVVTQTPAIKLYESLGFHHVKTETGAAKRGGNVYDEYEMELNLK